jgi:tRNA G10  N-methylase Trm11
VSTLVFRLADIQLGEIVCDPMCGGGSIPIEGALGFKQGYFLAGDCHEKATERTKGNLATFNNQIQADGIQWDATNIPMRDNSIDVFISDLVRLL